MRGEILSFVTFLLREAIEHGIEVAELIMSQKAIEDSALYQRLPRRRRIELLRARRDLQKAKIV